MEAQEIQTLKPTYSRSSSNGEKWLSIPLSACPNRLKRPCPNKKFRLDVGDGYLLVIQFSSFAFYQQHFKGTSNSEGRLPGTWNKNLLRNLVRSRAKNCEPGVKPAFSV